MTLDASFELNLIEIHEKYYYRKCLDGFAILRS